MTEISNNLRAFLSMIAASEGTDDGSNKIINKGYGTIVGGDNFTDYSNHPGKLVWLKPGLASTAAGRYQLLKRYWDVYKKQLSLPDFGPDSQDAVAIQQIKECKALDDIENGRIPLAISKCAHIWASLPGAGYNQHENDLGSLLAVYKKDGGTVV